MVDLNGLSTYLKNLQGLVNSSDRVLNIFRNLLTLEDPFQYKFTDELIKIVSFIRENTTWNEILTKQAICTKEHTGKTRQSFVSPRAIWHSDMLG